MSLSTDKLKIWKIWKDFGGRYVGGFGREVFEIPPSFYDPIFLSSFLTKL